MSSKVCIGQFAGAHGVRGLVKLKSFTADPGDVASYGPLTDEAGTRRFAVALTGTAKDAFIAKVEGIGDRDAAQALSGVRLYVDRDRLPEPEEEEFYHADLIGLRAERTDGVAVGTVRAVHDFGAGDVLEIASDDGRVELLPFTAKVVPAVDLPGGRIVIDPPLAVDLPADGERGEP
jgi:16S rRNA processing protein RimM